MNTVLVKRALKELQEKVRLKWPGNLSEAFNNYVSSYSEKSGEDFTNEISYLPYWLMLPVWLYDKFCKKDGTRVDEEFIRDIVWAQHCLILFLRIQDDILDRHSNDNLLILAADQFFIEAERKFNLYFAGSDIFWNIYYKNLSETILSAARIDHLQKSERINSEMFIEEYGNISSVFNIGAAAVAVKFNRTETLIHISGFIKEISLAEQILDDLKDIEEDLMGNKINYAFNLLSDFRNGLNEEKLPLNIFIKVLNKRLKKIFGEIRTHYLNSLEELKLLGIDEGKEFMGKLLENITVLEKDLYSHLMKFFLNNFFQMQKTANHDEQT